jgi:hypothetical protein
MAKVKIQGNASGAGVLTVTAPNTATDRTITLPDATGTLINTAPSTSGNVLTSDGTDWTSAAAGGGLYASVAIIADQKSTGTSSGTFTAGAWRTRDVNTEISDVDGIVSITSNQFTLQAGTYTLGWNAPAYRVAVNKSGLYNVTDVSFTAFGQSNYCNPAAVIQNFSTGEAVFTIASAKTYEIRHYGSGTYSLEGFGAEAGGGDGEVETYLIVKILKHS